MERIKKLIAKVNSDTLIRQSIITMILRVFGVATLFGFTLFITRNYSADIVGQYDFVRTFLLVTGSFSLLGMDQSILSFAGQLRAQKSFFSLKNVYVKMIKILFGTSFFFLTTIFLLNKEWINDVFNDSHAYSIIFKCCAVIFFNVVTLLNTEVIRALDDIYISELFRNTFKYLPVFVGAILLVLVGEKVWLIDFFIFGFILLSIITTIIVFKKFSKLKKDENDFEITTLKIIDHSYSMGISSLIIFLMLSIDVFLLKRFFNNEIVAYYSVSVKLMTVLSMVIVAVNINVSPRIAELFVLKNNDEIKKTLKKTARIIFSINLFIGFLLFFYNKEVLFLFGEEYLQSSTALRILVFTQVVCSLFGAAPVYLNMTQRQKVFKLILLISLLINLILNIILIPKYNMVGGALSFMISVFFWNIATAFFVWKKDKLSLFI